MKLDSVNLNNFFLLSITIRDASHNPEEVVANHSPVVYETFGKSSSHDRDLSSNSI